MRPRIVALLLVPFRTMTALDAATGAIRWQVRAPGIVVAGLVLIGTNTGSLYAVGGS